MSNEPKELSGGPGGPDPIIGKEIDGCTIVKKIGQGGMGIVYLAEHSKLRQQYVVKILNPALTAAEDTVQRFFREAQSVARLNHHGIVGIQNVGQEGEYYYIRMEYVDGDTVENIVKEQKKLDWKLATKIVHETAEALSHAHKKGTIHRDIKPENIMLTKQGEVKVMDFGLAKQVQAATKVSVTGQIVGTPFFMSPEQAGGKTVDARSDIYSLGVSYYYMLTGVKPFNGKNLQEIFLKHFFYTPESPKIYTPELPENVCEVIRRCLKKKKKERYQSAAQLADDVRAILEGGALSAAESGESTSELPSSPSSSDVGIVAPPDDAGKTVRSTAATGLDGGTGVGGDTVQRDVAAAHAEIGAGEPGTIVAKDGTPSPENGSATVIAKAVSDPPSGGEDMPAAPLQKRGGRMALAEAASASLVFRPGGAPFQTATAAPASEASSDLAAGTDSAPAGENGEAAVGNTTVKLDPNKKISSARVATPHATKAPAKKVRVGAIAGVILVGIGAYEGVGISRFMGIESDYARLQSEQPGPDDEAGWTNQKKSYDELADRLTDYRETFRLTPKGPQAEALAEKCFDLAKSAGGKAAEIAKGKAVAIIEERNRQDILNHLKESNQKLDGQLARVKSLIEKKSYKEADDLAIESYKTANVLKRGKEIEIALEITNDLLQPAKVFNAHTQEEIGRIGPQSTAAILVPYVPNVRFALEVRSPKFKSWKWEQLLTGYAKLKAILEREVTRRYTIGTTNPFARFTALAGIETLVVVAPMALDTQDPPTFDVLCHDGSLRSFELRNGRPRWPAPAMAGDYGDRLPSCDVVSGKAIITAGPDGLVTAHDVPTGNLVCSANVGAPVVAAPRMDPGANFAIVATLTGDVVCLDLVHGKNFFAPEIWRRATGAPILTQPVIQGNNVFVGCGDDCLRVLDARTGKDVARYDAREAVTAGPFLKGNDIYIGTRDGRIHAVNLTQGGDPQRPTFQMTRVFVTAPAGDPVIGIASSQEGVFYATKNDLRSIDATNGLGNKIFDPWTPPNDGIPLEITGFAPMNEAIGVVTHDGQVFSVDARSGALRWKQSLSAEVLVPPIFDGSDLTVTTTAGDFIGIAGD